MNLAALIGRILLISIFLASGIVELVSTESVRDVRLSFSMNNEDPLIHFLKNASILGGLLLTWAFGPGELSLDARRRDRAP